MQNIFYYVHQLMKIKDFLNYKLAHYFREFIKNGP